MRIAVLCGATRCAESPSKGKLGWHVEDLRRVSGDLDVELIPLDFRLIDARVRTADQAIRCADVDLDEIDRVLVRTMPTGTLEQVVFRMDILHRLVESGRVVVNSPRAIECAVDKYLALVRVAAAGLPVPATHIAAHADGAIDDFHALGGDVVVKPLFGSEGRGMMRISSPALAQRTFHTLERIGAVIYQQEFVPHPGWDLRVLVVGGQPVAAMRRHAADPGRDWQTNIAQGGRGEPHELTDDEADLALRASAAVGTEIAGVDLIQDRDACWHILELNASPGWKAIATVTGVDVAWSILDFLRRIPSDSSPAVSSCTRQHRSGPAPSSTSADPPA